MFEELIKQFTDLAKHCFKDTLTGVYLHGSMAMGCFNPKESDIDFLVITENDISDEQKLEFMNGIVKLNEDAPPKGLEMSIIKREYCKPFVYPTPFELHFSPMHLKWFQEHPDEYIQGMKGIDEDLAAHVTVTNHYGVVLYGAPIAEVFGEVSKKDYLDSIWYDVCEAKEEIKNQPMYLTLNLCRVVAFLQDGLCVSKKDGGEWGLANLPAKYHDLIRQALKSYATDGTMVFDEAAEIVFANDMVDKIISMKEKIQ